jgi:hypothetical protein
MFYFCSFTHTEDRSMLALREQRVSLSDLSAAEGLPSDRTRRVAESFAHQDQAVSAPLRSLAGGALDARFRSWRGASGRRYVFSVYNQDCYPAFEHAVAMIASVGRDGERRALCVEDTGSFPDISLAKAAARIPDGEEFEFHVHLLATSRIERAAVVADLSQACRS